MLGVLCILPDSACHTVSESARGDSGAGSQPTALSVPLSRPLTALDVSVLRSVAQLCPTLCDPTDGSPPGSSVRGSLQVGILEGAAMPSSRGSSRPGDQTRVSCTAGGFFRIWATGEAHEYQSGEPIPSPGDLPDPGTELGSLALQADSLPAEPSGEPSYICAALSHSVMSNSLPLHGLCLARLLCPWNSLGKNTGVGSHSLLQGIFPTQGLNPGLPHCRWILCRLSLQGSPIIKEQTIMRVVN